MTLHHCWIRRGLAQAPNGRPLRYVNPQGPLLPARPSRLSRLLPTCVLSVQRSSLKKYRSTTCNGCRTRSARRWWKLSLGRLTGTKARRPVVRVALRGGRVAALSSPRKCNGANAPGAAAGPGSTVGVPDLVWTIRRGGPCSTRWIRPPRQALVGPVAGPGIVPSTEY
jgi:hypothetical protein